MPLLPCRSGRRPLVASLAVLLAVLLPAALGGQQARANPADATTVLAAIRQVWPEQHHATAIRLARLESGLSPTARGCAGACLGLFQIHYPANRALLASLGIHSPERLLDPVVNSTVAYRIFRQSGWRPWGLQP